MLTYSGRIESGDALRRVDALSSQLRFGDRLLDESLRFELPVQFSNHTDYPLNSFEDDEILQNILAVPLYLLAEAVPGFGLIHTVWLFNVFVTALAGGVLFWYALVLRYDARTAVVVTLLFGLGTIVWAYSQTFFYEPLVLLFTLLAGLLLELWRQRGYRRLWWLVGAVVALGLATLNKNTAIFALPALFVIALPDIASVRTNRWFRRLLAAGLAFLVVFPIGLVLMGTPFDLLIRGATGGLFRIFYHVTFTQLATHSYLFSVGGSVWGTSPVVLLAVPGLWLLLKQGRQRYIWVVLLVVFVYVIAYPLASLQHWFGGLSWPPRFLIPVIPFLMLGALPVVARLTQKPRSWRWWIPAGFLLLYGIWIQFNALALDWSQYPKALPPESGGVADWIPGINQIQYLRWIILPSLWDSLGLDFAWVRAGTGLWAILFGLLGVISAGFSFYLLRVSVASKRVIRVVVLLPVIFLLCIGAGLRLIYDTDGLYRGTNTSLHAMLPTLQAETTADDVILLADDTYEGFIFNYAKHIAGRFITLPIQPGERLNPDDEPDVISDNPADLLTYQSIAVINHVAGHRDRVWLLAHNSAFLAWSVRPVERYLATYYYPIREIQTDPPDPAVRLIEFSTVPAPDPYAFANPTYNVDLYFGDHIALAGYELPVGTSYQAGDVLPLSLYWQTDAPLSVDYRVAWFIADDETGTVLAQQSNDAQPGWGFAPTTGWLPGQGVWDNRALRLPDEMPSATYQMWIVVYYLNDAGEIDRLPVIGQSVREETIGVLPARITIN